jgi:DNA primase
MSFDPSCIDVDDFLDCLDIENVTQATTTELRFSCPFPAHALGDETPSAYMNVETTAFFCHACHAKGNAIHFTERVLGISPLEAIRMLRQRYSPGGLDPDARSMTEEIRKILYPPEIVEPENPQLDDSLVQRFDMDWFLAEQAWREGKGWEGTDYMLERGFDAATLTEWEFGYDEASDRIVLPVRDENGVLVGFKARAWRQGHKPKYLNLGGERYGWPPFLKNQVVFGLDRAKEHGTHLIVVEGELNAIAMSDHGFPNSVAINGSYFGPKQMRLLRKYADSVTLFFDTDPAGEDATNAVAKELQDFMPVYVCPDHDGDPADMETEEVIACIEQAISTTRRRILLR